MAATKKAVSHREKIFQEALTYRMPWAVAEHITRRLSNITAGTHLVPEVRKRDVIEDEIRIDRITYQLAPKTEALLNALTPKMIETLKRSAAIPSVDFDALDAAVKDFEGFAAWLQKEREEVGGERRRTSRPKARARK